MFSKKNSTPFENPQSRPKTNSVMTAVTANTTTEYVVSSSREGHATFFSSCRTSRQELPETDALLLLRLVGFTTLLLSALVLFRLKATHLAVQLHSS